MLKRFILRNKQGGPRTPDLPADEKQKSPSLALVRHGCVFFSFGASEEDLGLSEVDGWVSQHPNIPPLPFSSEMCGASRPLTLTKWFTACRPHCTSLPVLLTHALSLDKWVFSLQTHLCYMLDWLRAHAWPPTATPTGYALDTACAGTILCFI